MAEETAQKPKAGVSSSMVASTQFEEWDYGPYKKFPSQRQKMTEFWLMRYDATIRAALFIIRFMILSRLGQYTHQDEKVQERVTDLLDRMEGGPKRTVRDLLSATWAGVSVAEKIWGTSGREWWIDRCDLLHPLSLFRPGSDKQGIKLDETSGRVQEITQWSRLENTFQLKSQTFPINRLVYWPMMQDVREQVYGNSLLEGARRAWFSKVKQENFWNTFGQKSAMPTPVFWLPHLSVTNDKGEKIPLSKHVADFYATLEPGMALAIPVDQDLQHTMDTITPAGTGEALERLCKYWDAQLFKAVLTPRLLMEEPEHASRAQSATQLDLFVLLLDGIREELGDVMIQQIVRPLVIYNIGDIGDYGTWDWDPLQDQDLEMLANILQLVERAKQSSWQSGRPPEPADDEKWRKVFSPVYASPEEVEQAQEREQIAETEGGAGGG